MQRIAYDSIRECISKRSGSVNDSEIILSLLVFNDHSKVHSENVSFSDKDGCDALYAKYLSWIDVMESEKAKYREVEMQFRLSKIYYDNSEPYYIWNKGSQNVSFWDLIGTRNDAKTTVNETYIVED